MGTWRGDPDDAAARFLAEHGIVSEMVGGDLVLSAGSEALLPAWPPGIAAVVLCAVCATPVVRHGEAGWRHEVSLADRGGCVTPWPEG